MTATLTIVQDTWLTLSKLQSTDLPDDQKHHVLAGESFPLSSHEADTNLMRVTLDRDRLSQSNPFSENVTWYVKVADVEIIKGSPVRLASFFSGFSGIVEKFFPKKPDTDTP